MAKYRSSRVSPRSDSRLGCLAIYVGTAALGCRYASLPSLDNAIFAA